MKQETPRWECVLDSKPTMGECPVWSEADGRLYWTDNYGPAFNATDPETGRSQTWPMPLRIGSFALKAGGGTTLVALADGLHDLDLSTGRLAKLFDGPYDQANYAFNDGRCDRQGRFWVGTARLPTSNAPDGGAHFYRLDPDGPNRLIGDLTIANGIAFSPDGRTLYLANCPRWEIPAFDYDTTTAAPTNRQRFASVPEGEIPDGAAVDRDGGYWIAMFRCGRIYRFVPDGRLDRDLKAPVSLPTMVAFGGSDHRHLYLTTGRRQLDAEGLRREPQAGGIFRCDAVVRGLPEPALAAS
ncbi:MAG: SMP-30/gluconolactonase/LRE family protein [Alphaproteobacteria bacterium]|nr:SMP-30/gluconolactonase/LRE family protein [Alphaproteobacteria bacterium]